MPVVSPRPVLAPQTRSSEKVRGHPVRRNFNYTSAKDPPAQWVDDSRPDPANLYPEVQKSRTTCEMLRSSLPSFDSLKLTLSKNGTWWSSFRQKTHAIAQVSTGEGLVGFATRIYTSSNPAELGLLVTAYARSIDDGRKLYALVERLVISDFAILATLEGIECLLLLAKSYTDIGQPRRAWVAWRRGLAAAQLMGIYRDGGDPRGQRLWWAVWHGDRFTSLLLGLPHGFNDNYYSGALELMKANGVPPEHRFVLQCALIAGKIIDRNVRPGKPSFAETIALDEQMDEIATLLPHPWWETPEHLPTTAPDQDQLRDRLLVQFYYFHVRIYLHLPFIASSTTSHRHVSGIACMEAARELLQRFLLLRRELDGVPFFECKTSGFVGFTAAVVLMIGLSSPRIEFGPRQDDIDWDLIQSIRKGFQVEANKRPCKMSAQCATVLEILMANHDRASYDTMAGTEELKEILIPYFGVVVTRRRSMRADGDAAQARMRIDNTSAIPSYAQDSEENRDICMDTPTFAIHYQGYNLPAPIIGNAGPEFGDFGGPDAAAQSLWVDLDQDWGSFTDMYDGMTSVDESRLWWEG